jgi:hypothetical protein
MKVFPKLFLCAALMSILFPKHSYASDDALWGCEVLLCLANPAGPMAAPYCVKPIKKLFTALAKFPPDPFPKCKEAGPGNYADIGGQDHYDDCPAGQKHVKSGVLVTSTTSAAPYVSGNKYKFHKSKLKYPYLGSNSQEGSTVDVSDIKAIFTGIGDGPSYYDPDYAKVCVSGPSGKINLSVQKEDFWDDVIVQVYDNVSLVYPYKSSSTINVVLDGKPAGRVRY